MGMVLPPWPHAAAVTETSVRTIGEKIRAIRKPGRSVRIHGKLILSHGTRRVGPRSSSVDETHQVAVVLDHRALNIPPAMFRSVKCCCHLIHDVLAEALATSGNDLTAAGNWVDLMCTASPLDIATAIVQHVEHKYDDVPESLEFDVHLPELRVTLVYSEPKALLLACKEAAAAKTEAAGALARRREPGGELCPICMMDVETEENVTLPCSHPFHGGCILSWFHRGPTCPTCRRDIMECFPAVRSASSAEEVIHDETYPYGMFTRFDDESEDEPDVARAPGSRR